MLECRVLLKKNEIDVYYEYGAIDLNPETNIIHTLSSALNAGSNHLFRTTAIQPSHKYGTSAMKTTDIFIRIDEVEVYSDNIMR